MNNLPIEIKFKIQSYILIHPTALIMKQHFNNLILKEIKDIFIHINYQIGRSRIRSHKYLMEDIDDIIRLTRLYETWK